MISRLFFSGQVWDETTGFCLYLRAAQQVFPARRRLSGRIEQALEEQRLPYQVMGLALFQQNIPPPPPLPTSLSNWPTQAGERKKDCTTTAAMTFSYISLGVLAYSMSYLHIYARYNEKDL